VGDSVKIISESNIGKQVEYGEIGEILRCSEYNYLVGSNSISDGYIRLYYPKSSLELVKPAEETKPVSNPNKFWFCYVDNTYGYSVKHGTPEEASEEAERLARLPQNINKKVYVLEAVKMVTVPESPVTWTDIK